MGSPCCKQAETEENQNPFSLRSPITRSVINTEGPVASMGSDEDSEDSVPHMSDERALERLQMIVKAHQLLQVILYQPAPQNLNSKLKKLTSEQKIQLFGSFAKNFSLKWLQKFDKEAFRQYRLEYVDDKDLDEDEFELMDLQDYKQESVCRDGTCCLMQVVSFEDGI